MTTALSQYIGSSPPQLPGSTVLRIDTAQSMAVLRHDLGTPIDTLHARLMLNADQAGGGKITIAGGMDTAGEYVWQLVLDTDAPALALHIGDQSIGVPLARLIAWQAVEVGLDALAGSATLRINGIERGSISTAFNATRHTWVGGAFAAQSVLGTIEIDHWVLSTTPIGVAVSEPTADHGADPRRWLVIYNRDDQDSVAWADAYRSRRDVPYANLCGLALPTEETISAPEFEAMRQQISEYLTDNNLDEQVVGVLLGYGVPGYADVQGLGSPTPIASYLHTDDTHGLPVVNPMYQAQPTTRPTALDYTSVRLTGRVDAPTLADALALLDRADALTAQPLAYDGLADVVIDINPDNPGIGPIYTDPVEQWATGLGLSALRLPTVIYDATAPSNVSGESCVWGWRDAAPPAGFFSTPTGRRALCIQLHPEPLPADSARDLSGTDWMSAALSAGYAAAGSPSRAYSLSSVPLAPQLFEALGQGWTLAEAWMIAQPFLRDGLQIVGDPLMTIGFPKAGYDVFGPVDRLDQIDPSQPTAILHAGQTSYDLPPEDAPATGSSARYLVQRRDEEGRADLASASVHAGIEVGQVIEPAPPAWPSDEGWRVARRHGQMILPAFWPASLRSLGVDRVEVFGQTALDDAVLLDDITPAAGQGRARIALDPPSAATRYRFRVVQGPAFYDSPWSEWVEPITALATPITPLEGSS